MQANVTTAPGNAGEAHWSAVLERNARLDGAIFYGVRSTKIYCRPSCPSRRPRRNQVRFFFSPEAAERQGYRACKRCRPRSAEFSDPKLKLVREVCKHIERSLADPEVAVNLKALATRLDVSPFHLQRAFKQVTGISPRQYLEARRLDEFKNLMRKGDDVTSAIYEVGYSSSSRIYEKSAAHLGMSPAEYRDGAADKQIRYAVGRSPMGVLLLGATAKGVCSVKIGDSESVLLHEFKAEFSKARLKRDDDALGEWLKTVLDALDGKCDGIQSLPLDIRTTAFQRRVYEELKRIPTGETRTYSEIAECLGGASGRRAVARACATNNVAVIIPCHRVVRSDGGLGGYRWGLDRKKELLKKEKESK
jgi:AraC family transcriptional regulator of adaptative response/methylated-DNA-[protein]-cysteine methyltransferase